MPKPLSKLSLDILSIIQQQKLAKSEDIVNILEKKAENKKITDAIYRLEKSELLAKQAKQYFLTEAGLKVIHIKNPEPDGIWKIVIFDIPEKDRAIRNILRQKLQDLGFKKWQNSIWVSPYALESSVEQELNLLSEKYFIRLIKTTQINNLTELLELFPSINLKDLELKNEG